MEQSAQLAPPLFSNPKDDFATIKQIKANFYAILPEFTQYYVLHHKNPEVDEYADIFNDKRAQLYSLTKQLHDLGVSIEDKITRLDEEMEEKTVVLNKTKAQNKKLNAHLHSLQNAKHGSRQLVRDSIAEYIDQRIQNGEIFVGILLLSGTMYYQIKNNTNII